MSSTDDSSSPHLHLYLLLDRSGSMAAMADDVIGGFNRLLVEQQGDGTDAVTTLVQFDSQDPQHTLADGVPIAEVVPLDHATFVPRGATPLLDATGLLLGRAAQRAGQRREAGLPKEEILFVSITDGHENASQEFTLSTIRQLVDAHTAAGWTFAFLGAALDVYDEASDLGYRVGSTQSFLADGQGSSQAFDSLSRATSAKRMRIREDVDSPDVDFFIDKSAEEDRRRRGA